MLAEPELRYDVCDSEGNPPLASLSVSEAPNLGQVNASGCSLCSVCFGPCHPKLSSISLVSNNLEELDLASVSLPSLSTLCLGKNRLRKLELNADMAQLSEIDVSSNRLRRLSLRPLGKAGNLSRLALRENYLTTIELSEGVHPQKLDYISFGRDAFYRRHECHPVPAFEHCCALE